MASEPLVSNPPYRGNFLEYLEEKNKEQKKAMIILAVIIELEKIVKNPTSPVQKVGQRKSLHNI